MESLPWKQSIDPWENPFCIYRSLHFLRVGGTTIHSMEFTEDLLPMLYNGMEAELISSLVFA
jgi:hypothetical protein